MGISVPPFCRDWIKDQHPASFKGVEFAVESDTHETGRRLVIHEYPSREAWDTEDLGRRASIVPVVGFVFGEHADERSQELLAACSSPGADWLILPLRPPRRASCLHVNSTFEADAMGRFRFEMEFVLEARGVGGVVSSILLAGAVAEAVESTLNELRDDFALNFEGIDAPPSARDAAAVTIRNAGKALDKSRRSIRIGNEREAAEVDLAARRMREHAYDLAYHGNHSSRIDAETLVRDQRTVDSGFADLLRAATRHLKGAAIDPAEAILAFAEMTNFRAQKSNSEFYVGSVAAARLLTKQIAALVRRSAMVRWAGAITNISYPSRRDAITARASIAVAFEGELETVENPDVERALRHTLDTAMDYLTKSAADLPGTLKIALNRPMPAVVLAYRIYNDATKADELIRRNSMEHPLYSPLEIEALRPQARP